MGDSFSGFDASKYMYDGSSSNYNPTAVSDSGKKTTIETVDFSGDASSSSSNSSVNNYIRAHGDANGDGKVDINDVTAIQKSLSEQGKVVDGKGDVNGDGRVTVKDATILQKYLGEEQIPNSMVGGNNNGTGAEQQLSSTDPSIETDSYTLYVQSKAIEEKNAQFEKQDINNDGVHDAYDLMAIEKSIKNNEGKYTEDDLNALKQELINSGAILETPEKVSDLDPKDFVNTEYPENICNTELEYFGYLDFNHDGIIDLNDAEEYYKHCNPYSYRNDDNPVVYYLKNVRNQALDSIKYESYVDELMLKYADANGDGKVTALDVTFLQKAIQNGDEINFYHDLDGDGQVTDLDVAIIQNYLVGNATEQNFDYNKKEAILASKRSNLYNLSNNLISTKLANIGTRFNDEIYISNEDEYLYYRNFYEPLGSKTNIVTEYEYDSDYVNDKVSQYESIMSLKMTDSYTASLKESIMICNDLKAIINHKNSVSGGGTGNNNSQIQEIDAYLSQLEKDLSFAPYNKHLDTIEYLEFCNNYDPKTATEAGDPYAEIEQFCGNQITGGLSYKTYYETYYSKASSNFKFKNGNDEEWHEVMFNLAYMNKDELNMYHYIFNTEGKDAAEKYIDLIQDELIQRCGTEGAFAYINALERDDINFDDYMLEHGDVDGDGKVTINDISLLQSNIKDNKDCSTYDVDGDGKVDSGDVSLLQRYVAGDETLEEDIDYKPLSDSAVNNFMTILAGYDGGIQGYCEGLYNALHDNESLTVEEYKNAIILQYLLKKDPDLARKYKISSAIGNMTIPVTASVLVSIATENPEIGRKVGSVLMGVSAFGNAKHQALVEGHDKISSYSYGALTGLSETISDYMLSGIPGLGKSTGFNVLSIGKEMLQEGLQEYMDAGFRYVCFGEKIDLGELSGDALDAAINGGIVAIIMNGGNATVHFTIEGVDYVVEGGKLTDLVSKKARGITVNDILGIAVVDMNVTQFSNKYNCSLEEATTMLSVINATSEEQRAAAVSKLSDADVCKVYSHLKKTGNTKVYNQFLVQMSSEQYVALIDSGKLSDAQITQLRNDMASMRNKVGKNMNSSVDEINQIYKNNWIKSTMKIRNVSECVATSAYIYYQKNGNGKPLSASVYKIMEDGVFAFGYLNSDGNYITSQKTRISAENAQLLVNSIGEENISKIYPKIKDYCTDGGDGTNKVLEMINLHDKYGISWENIAAAYSSRKYTYEGPVYDISEHIEKTLKNNNDNSGYAKNLKTLFKNSMLSETEFANKVETTVISDLSKITHVDEYMKYVYGEMNINDITIKNPDGTYVYDDIINSDFFANYSVFPIGDTVQMTNYVLANSNATLKEIQVAKSYLVEEINNIPYGKTTGSSGRSLTELNSLLQQLEAREDAVSKATRDKLYKDYKPKKDKEKLVNSGQAEKYVLGDGRKSYSNEITQQRVKELGLHDANAQKKINSQIDGYAKQYGVTFDEMKLTLDNKISEFISDGEFGTRKGVSTLEKCLDSGSIKNQFETGTTSGAKNLSLRADVELDLFDTDTNSPYSDRPIYGMVFPSLDDPNFNQYAKSGPGAFYGRGSDLSDKCIILFNKDAVFDNTSYTIGDSLVFSVPSYGGACVEASPVSNPEFCGSFNELVGPSKFSDMNDINNASLSDMFSKGTRYLELQVHGSDAHEMNSTNIKEVIFYAEPSESLQKKLKKANIPWKVI